jgi:hypothetical protein
VEKDPTSETQELKLSQLRRESAERRAEEQEPSPEGVEKHGRRAEKAAYLKEKLGERAEAERRAAEEDAGGAEDAR